MKKHFTILILSLILSGCSLNQFIIRQTGTILEYGIEAMYEETDLVLAEQALAGNLKLLEGMTKGDPENKKLLLMTAQAYAGYALGFVEDSAPERAKVLYLRARDFGLRVLRMNDSFRAAENKPVAEWETAVKQFDTDDVDALFWTAFSWAGWINLSLDNPRAFIDLAKVQVLMQRVLELNESYFHGAADLFFGSIWGTRPRMLGGDPEKAKKYFERNLEITGGNFLLTYIYYAKYYAAKTLDEEKFDELIKKVENTPVDVLPGYQLLNAIAKRKAALLKEQREEIF